MLPASLVALAAWAPCLAADTAAPTRMVGTWRARVACQIRSVAATADAAPAPK